MCLLLPCWICTSGVDKAASLVVPGGQSRGLIPGCSIAWSGLGVFGTELLAHVGGAWVCPPPFPMSHPNEQAVLVGVTPLCPVFKENGPGLGL